jgi:Zn-finger nucleic acid-binding protein
MREVSAEQLVYDRCDCGALWFDGHELDEYVRRFAQPPRRLEGAPRRERAADTLVCPRCNARSLAAFTVDGVPLHACDGCRGHLLEHEASLARLGEASKSSTLLDVALLVMRCFGTRPN